MGQHRFLFALLAAALATALGCGKRPEPLSLGLLIDRLGRPVDAATRARLVGKPECGQRELPSGVRVEGCLSLRSLIPSGCGHSIVAFIHPPQGETILAAVGAIRCPAKMARLHLGRLWGEPKEAEEITGGLYRFSEGNGPDGYLAELPSYLGLGAGAYRFGFGVTLGSSHPAYVSPAALLPR